MRVFVTGGTGFFGSHLVESLLAAGHEVTLVSRDQEKVDRFPSHPGLKALVEDLESFAPTADLLRGYEACIHNAILWDEDPTELDLKDPQASARLFEAAGEAGVHRVIYTSSAAVHRPFRMVMTEEDALAPADSYGAIKACSELLLSSAANRFGFQSTSVRPGPIVGRRAFERAPFKTDRRIAEFKRRSEAGEGIVVTEGDGRQLSPARDLAELYVRLLSIPVMPPRLVAVSPEVVTWQEIALSMVRAASSGSEIQVTGPRVDPPVFDTGLLESIMPGFAESKGEMLSALSG